MIPYGKQSIDQSDIDAVVDVLKSDFLTQGAHVPRFEKALCDYSGAAYACVSNSATSALHIACLALGLKTGDIVWTSPISFVASANCALYCGADVDFVDIDPLSYNLSPQALAQKLSLAEASNTLPKILIPVHLAGQSCDMEAIKALCDKYDVKIIEDASHAIGGRYKDAPVGNCRYCDITVFSFHPVKIITTGEGGAALTNSEDLNQRLHMLRSHGVTRDVEKFEQESPGPWYYEQQALGFNYRMTDLQAALGLSQLERLHQFVRKRHELIAQYDKLLKDLPLTLPYCIEDAYTASHLYIIRLREEISNKSHSQVFQSLRENGVGVNLHYIPIHTQPYYRNRGKTVQSYPQAEAYAQSAISLPMHPGLNRDEQEFVASCLRLTLT